MKRIALLLLLLVACQYAPFQKPKIQPPPPELFTGTSSLDVKFNPASMSSVFMCSQADVFVDVANSGSYNIENGLYSFISEDQFLKPLSAKQERFSLKGKSRFDPVGEFRQIHFKLQNLGIPSQFESFVSPLIFQACYKYKTLASAPVCIDPDIQNLNPVKPCQPRPVVLSGGQGAPVAVTRVEPRMVPEGDKVKPMFAIYVQHLGSGSVVKEEGAESACTGGPSGAAFANFADVSVELQGRKLQCDPAEVRIDTGKESSFFCKDENLYDISAGTFSTVLSIDLSYGYVNTVMLPVTVTRIPGQEACK